MSEIKSKLNITERKNLASEIPISTPFVIQIDPSSKCNFKCKFCPTGNVLNNNNKSIMPLELFNKLVRDLKEFNTKVKVVKLWKDGEPLLNPYLPDMIYNLKDSDTCEKVEITTNGYLLNSSLSTKLVASGLDKIIISIEGTSEDDYLNLCGVKIDFDKLIKNIEFLNNNKKNCKIHIKMIDAGLSEEKKNNFYTLFKDLSNEIFIEKAVPCWPNFSNELIDGVKQNVWGENIIKKLVCPMPFYSLAINSNGIVNMCCNDWEQKINVGDISTSSLKDIWEGLSVKNFQILQLNKKRNLHPVCSKCLYPDYVAFDFIDDSADLILKKIITKE